ncbi:MAG: phosphatase PAP2-related protein [Ignavibacteriales bacterium]|nr:phosphatase PAP2-related protein [Ignavibacteriales bacterium]
MNKILEIKSIWKEALSDKTFRIKFVITIILLALVLFFLANFLAYNEHRPGVPLNDPFLSSFNPVDLTWLTFILIYGGLITALVFLSFHPARMLTALQSYTLISALRMITIYFLPLEAPVRIIPLTDPFVEFFGGGTTLLRDLFFSGHTSTMFLFFLTAKGKKLKVAFLVCTFLVASFVLLQHVHYTIDVIAAPFFAYTGYRISRLVNKNMSKNNS